MWGFFGAWTSAWPVPPGQVSTAAGQELGQHEGQPAPSMSKKLFGCLCNRGREQSCGL